MDTTQLPTIGTWTRKARPVELFSDVTGRVRTFATIDGALAAAAKLDGRTSIRFPLERVGGFHTVELD